ncbi:MAG: hypothetical protein A3E38_02650 [Candidatus Moranbacteria bacterium RIFCSPHIGHO2_12_FULL_54_9]|nr:MAG: hypothetical protein A2878_01835 [Candidatus Moranbacteria bacterium RIFCSPHIGHO2_01_FULL_54_31]OGI25351.1 MAG: hypothetical protein A3E38_02650 [Candidatus Moranbacteria bacterium RIFCSPHIGHO2_12_FULL_54_9]
MNAKQKQCLKGSALVYGLVIMTTVAIVLTSILSFIASQTKYALRVHAREQALQISESGIHFYRWYLAHQVEGRTAQQVQDFWTSGSPYGVATAYEVEYTDPSGDAVGKYRLEVTPPVLGSTIVTVRSTGWTYRYPSDTRSLEVRFRRPSWSESAVLANDFMRFGAGTEVFGTIHSNQGIRFDGVAHNIVSSSVSAHDDPDHTGENEFGVHTHDSPTDPLPPASVPARTDVFEAGRTFPVASVDFNGVLGDLSLMKSVAQAGTDGSRYFDNTDVGRRIILKTNGTADVCRVASASLTGTGHTNGILSYRRNSGSGTCGTCSGLCLSNYPIPDNGVIFVEDNAWVEGQVNGEKVTIVAADLLGGSPPSLYIGSDIMYSSYTGSDIIGLIAQKNIEIIRDSDTNLRIDGALLAQAGRVGREYYDGRVKSVITVYGAIATNLRYGFAYTNGTGYTTRNLYYDNNLLYYPPPYFPTGTQYEMDLWEEK